MLQVDNNLKDGVESCLSGYPSNSVLKLLFILVGVSENNVPDYKCLDKSVLIYKGLDLDSFYEDIVNKMSSFKYYYFSDLSADDSNLSVYLQVFELKLDSNTAGSKKKLRQLNKFIKEELKHANDLFVNHDYPTRISEKYQYPSVLFMSVSKLGFDKGVYSYTSLEVPKVVFRVENRAPRLNELATLNYKEVLINGFNNCGFNNMVEGISYKVVCVSEDRGPISKFNEVLIRSNGLLEKGYIRYNDVDMVLLDRKSNVLFAVYRTHFPILRIKPMRYVISNKVWDKYRNSRYIGSIDIETYLDGQGKHIIYAGGFKISSLRGYGHIFPSDNKGLYYLGDESCLTSEDLIVKLFTDLSNYDLLSNTVFYGHNFFKFDLILLLEGLLKNGFKVNLNYRNHQVLKVLITCPNHAVIRIFDSYRFFKSSLDNLGKSFSTPIQKGDFPHEFVNSSNIHYIGDTPDSKYFKKEVFFRNDWNLREECLKYLSADLKCLLMVMYLFSEKMFLEYKVRVWEHTSLPSAVITAYLLKYYNPDVTPIALCKGNLNNSLRKASVPGRRVLRSHYLKHGYLYDINSAYPLAMVHDLPVGVPKLVSEVMDLNLFYGYVYAVWYAPSDLEYPFLMDKTKNINRYAQFGEGWYFSSNLLIALSLGYKITLSRGIAFDKGKPFKSWVEHLYELKRSALNSVSRTLAKNMINYTYGWWGMKENESVTEIVNTELLNKIMSLYTIIEWFPIGDSEYFLVSYMKHIPNRLLSIYTKYSNEIANVDGRDLIKIKSEDQKDIDREVSDLHLNRNAKFNSQNAGLSSAITSIHDIHLYQTIISLWLKGIKVYYSDVDNIIVDTDLTDILNIGDNLGEWKLEAEGEMILIRLKGYAIKDKNNILKIAKFSGIKRNKLQWSDYDSLLKGNDLHIPVSNFYTSFMSGSIINKDQNLIIKGVDVLNDDIINTSLIKVPFDKYLQHPLVKNTRGKQNISLECPNTGFDYLMSINDYGNLPNLYINKGSYVDSTFIISKIDEFAD